MPVHLVKAVTEQVTIRALWKLVSSLFFRVVLTKTSIVCRHRQHHSMVEGSMFPNRLSRGWQFRTRAWGTSATRPTGLSITRPTRVRHHSTLLKISTILQLPATAKGINFLTIKSQGSHFLLLLPKFEQLLLNQYCLSVQYFCPIILSKILFGYFSLSNLSHHHICQTYQWPVQNPI